jgi:hypothetical protein
LELGDGDYDVDTPDLGAYERIGVRTELDVTDDVGHSARGGCGCLG